MPITTRSIIAAFRDKIQAETAASDLRAAGIPPHNIYLETASATWSKPEQQEFQQGGIAGWFRSLFDDQDNRDRSLYENAARQGIDLLRVDVTDQQVSAVEVILNRHSPVDIQEDNAGQVGGAGSTAARTPASAQLRENAQAIPVVEEELRVGKRQVLRGGVRVYSRVVEEPVEQNISLREEVVRVERRPVNRNAADADLFAGQQEVIEVREFAEEPVVTKQARVVEEVRVRKDVSERAETVRDTVRHTEATIERVSTGEFGYGGRGISFKLVFSEVPRDRIDQFVSKLGDVIRKNGGQLHRPSEESDERVRVAASGPEAQKITAQRG